MLQQKAFKKSNLHSMIWIYRERRDKEIVCNKKYTLSIENGIIGVTKLRQCYIDNQVSDKHRRRHCLMSRIIFKTKEINE